MVLLGMAHHFEIRFATVTFAETLAATGVGVSPPNA